MSLSKKCTDSTGQLNKTIQQLSQIIQPNAASAEEMASGSEELSSQAAQLKDLLSFSNIGHTSYSRSKSKKQQVPLVQLGGTSVENKHG